MRRPWTFERRLIGSKGGLLPPGPVGSAAPAPPTTPLTILGSKVLQWCRGDSVNTVTTFDWFDQSGAGRHYTQATAAAQPAYTASDATCGNRGTILFDGSDDNINCASFALPAPGTTPTYIGMIIKQVSWTSADRIVSQDSGTDALIVRQTSASPRLDLFNASGANQNAIATLNTWRFVEAYFSASVADYLTISGTVVTGASAGSNTPSAGRNIGGINPGTPRYGNFHIAEIFYCNADVTAGERTSLASYITDWYGGAVSV